MLCLSTDGHHTVLVSLTQSLLHYTSVCSKLGVQLHSKPAHSFVFVDGLTSLLSDVLPSATTPDTSTTAFRSEDRVCISIGRYVLLRICRRQVYDVAMLCSDYSLASVYKSLKQVLSSIQRPDNTLPVCLIVDGLSVLLNVGVALSQVVALVQTCVHMLTSSSGPCQVS